MNWFQQLFHRDLQHVAVAADLMTLNSELPSDSALELAEMIADGKLA